MGIEILISDLKERYTYSHKLLNALRKIIPAMIEYYGNFTSPIIYRALLSCEIILCDSYETISLLMSNRNKLEPNNIIKKDLKNLSSYYYSYPYIKYDSLLSSYVIDKIDRKIFVSHAHNIESPKGLSSLTRAIIAILRSYVKEYQLVDDTLIKNIGLQKEEYKIINQKEIEYQFVSSKYISFEEGIESLEEEQITSIILKDEYQTFDYDLLKNTFLILYDLLNLKQTFLKATFSKEFSLINKRYNLKEGLFFELSSLLDEVLILENRKIITVLDRKEYQKELSMLMNKLYDNFILFKKCDLLLFSLL